MAGLNTTTANMAWVSLLVLLLAHSTLESPKKARGRPRIRSRNRPQVQNDQPMTDVGRGRRAPQSEYYYAEEYNAGGDGPSRSDQSLVSPEITPAPTQPTTARPASTTPYYVPTITSYTEEVKYPCADYKPGDDDLQSFDFIRKFELDVNLDGYPGVARVRGSNRMQ